MKLFCDSTILNIMEGYKSKKSIPLKKISSNSDFLTMAP